jgi:hypothetical protein
MTATAPRWRLPEQASVCRFSGVPMPRSKRPAVLVSARMQIRDLLASTTLVDGLESGGMLATHTGGFQIVEASGLGPNAIRTERSIRADPDFDFQLFERWRATGLEPIGDWHAHVGDDGEPSGERGDLSAWSARRRLLEIPRYVAMIVSESRDAWSLSVYVVESGHAAVDLCRPAGTIRL